MYRLRPEETDAGDFQIAKAFPLDICQEITH